MDIGDAMKILRYISTAYPAYKPQYDPQMRDDAIKLWASSFVDVPGNIVMGVVDSYVKSGHEFAPSVGQIRQMLKEMVMPEINDEQAWDMVRKATSNGLYHSVEEFEKLPEVIQKTLGSPHVIYSLAMLPPSELSYEKNSFVKSYRVEVERRKHIENLPNSVREIIEQMKSNAPVIENKQQAARLEMKNHYEDAYARTVSKFVNGDDGAGDAEERSERGTGFAQMLREKLNMPEFELGAEDEQEKPDGYKIYDEDDINLDDVPFDDEGIFA